MSSQRQVYCVCGRCRINLGSTETDEIHPTLFRRFVRVALDVCWSSLRGTSGLVVINTEYSWMNCRGQTLSLCFDLSTWQGLESQRQEESMIGILDLCTQHAIRRHGRSCFNIDSIHHATALVRRGERDTGKITGALEIRGD